MLIELKDIKDELFMLNPDHIVEFCRIKNTDNYTIKTLVGERTIDSAMAIYLHSSPTLSLSIIKLDEVYLEQCKKQVQTSTMFPALNPRVDVVQPDKNLFFKGDTYQLVYNKVDSEGAVTFKSSDNNIATVSATGLVTFKAIGLVTVMASIEGGTPGAAILKCISVDLTVTPTVKSAYVDSAPFTVNSNALVSDKPTWTSSAPEKATVTADGLVSFISFGEVNIKANVRGEEAMCVVNIAEPSITVSKSAVNLQRGGTETVTATVTNLENKEVLWTSDKESVATVVNGTITAVGSGRANIKASTAHGFKTIVVDVEAIVLTGDATKTMTEGTNGSWTVSVAGSNLKANYISSDVSIATIDPNTGAISAKVPGSVTLTATVLDVTKTCALTVEAIPAPPEPGPEEPPAV